MATAPAYAATPIVDASGTASAQTGVTGLSSGSSNVISGAVGTTNGKRIARVKVTVAVAGASTASVVNFFYSPDGGTTLRMISSVLCPVVTSSNSVACGTYYAPDLVGLELVSTSAILYWTTTIGQQTNVHVESAGL